MFNHPATPQRLAAPVAMLALAMLTACQSTTIAGDHAMQKPDARSFGKTKAGRPVQLYTLKNDNGMTARLTDYGATLVELHVPDSDGDTVDVVNGFDSVAGYQSDANQYFGHTIGPVANRIANAEFTLNDKTYNLPANDGDHTLHSGAQGSLDEVVWEAKTMTTDAGHDAIRFTYTHPERQAGFPGNLYVRVRYSLTDDNTLRIEYKASTDQATPVNLTNHSYFNLQGHGSSTIRDHVLTLNASRYTPVDDELIPTGEIAKVDGTPLDFTEPTAIGKRLDTMKQRPAGGYDHNYVLDKANGEMGHVATLNDPTSGRVMKVFSTEPGVQFYSGNFLFGQDGKDGESYQQHAALCLETQHYPDAVHHENFPSIILEPDETYRSVTEYRFSNK